MYHKFISLAAGLMLLVSVASAQQKPFTLSGTISGKTGKYIYLTVPGDQPGKALFDSAIITNGRFLLKGKVEGPAQAYLSTVRQARSYDDYVQLYIVPADMQLSLDSKNLSAAVLKGSPVQAEADALNKVKAPIMARLKVLSKEYDNANMAYINARKEKKAEATLDSLKDIATQKKNALEPYQEQLGKLDEEFMDQHPASFVTASMLRFRISGMRLQEGEARFNKLPEAIKNSSLGRELKEELDGLRMGSPGATAFVFASKELRGEPLSLADYKGKYVLVDFWASWCVPCRAGNPHLKQLYSKYKDKGFEIIGISDDDGNLDAWQKAVDKDGIGVWKHVLRGLKRVDGPQMFDRSADISDRYGIHSLPTKILIDPNGVIIGRYGGGGEGDEAMDKKLAQIFGS